MIIHQNQNELSLIYRCVQFSNATDTQAGLTLSDRLKMYPSIPHLSCITLPTRRNLLPKLLHAHNKTN